MAGLYIERKRTIQILKWFVCVAVAVILIFAGYYMYRWYTVGDRPPLIPLPASAYADSSVDETPVASSDIDNYTVPPTHPRYISIPALNVDKARVKVVGLTKNNILEMPQNIHDTAWYDKSAFPGQGYGAVLIDGHGSGVGNHGVFINLDKLKNGDEIVIERGDGIKITYIVVENRTESLKDANTTGMKRLLTPFDTAKEGLGLITNAGNWVPRDKVFDKRILVRAVAKASLSVDEPDTVQASAGE